MVLLPPDLHRVITVSTAPNVGRPPVRYLPIQSKNNFTKQTARLAAPPPASVSKATPAQPAITTGDVGQAGQLGLAIKPCHPLEGVEKHGSVTRYTRYDLTRLLVEAQCTIMLLMSA